MQLLEVKDLTWIMVREGAFVNLTDLMLITKDNKAVPIDYSAAPIRDDGDNITGEVLVLHDITERVQAERELKQTAEALGNQTRVLQSISVRRKMKY